MSDLSLALAQAGKLKQLCQAVLAVVTAAEQIGPLETILVETQGRIDALRLVEAQAKAQATRIQETVPREQEKADAIVRLAQAQADTLMRDTTAAMTRQTDEAQDTVRLAYEAKQQLDADIVLCRQTLTAMQADTHAQEIKLADAKALIRQALA